MVKKISTIIIICTLLAGCGSIKHVVLDSHGPPVQATQHQTLTETISPTNTLENPPTQQVPPDTASPTYTPSEIPPKEFPDLSDLRVEYYKPVAQLGNGVINDIAWHPENKEIAVATPLGIRFHNPNTLLETGFWPMSQPINAIIFTSDGQLIGGDKVGGLQIWGPEGNVEYLNSALDSICSLTLSPNERMLAVGECAHGNYANSKDRVEIWNISKLNPIGTIQTQKSRLAGVTFSPASDVINLYEIGDGLCSMYIPSLVLVEPCTPSFCDGWCNYPVKVVGSIDGTREGTIGAYSAIWDKAWDDEEDTLLVNGICDMCDGYDLAYTTDSKYLVAGVYRSAVVFDVDSQELMSRGEGPARNFSISPDGAYYVSDYGFGLLGLFDTFTGEKLVESNQYWGALTAIAVAPNQNHFIAGFESGFIKSWDIRSFDLQFSQQTDLLVASLNYQLDGKYILFQGASRYWGDISIEETKGILEADTGILLKKFGGDLFNWYGIDRDVTSPDGLIRLAGNIDGSISIVDVRNEQEIGKFLNGTARVHNIAIIAEGDEYLVFFGGNDGLVNVWILRVTAVPKE